MILLDNLPKLYDIALSHERVLDVGGWYRPFNLATHVVDIQDFGSRQNWHALDPEHEERFSNDTWCQIDACNDPWPFPEDYFDFSICSHTLEDLPDPVSVCEQLARVSKAGYIEVPSIIRELYVKDRWCWLSSLVRRPLEIGFPHHHWLCEISENQIFFTPKNTTLIQSTSSYLTRYSVGRKLSQKESGICLWWEKTFHFKENSSPTAAEIIELKKKAITTVS